MFLTNKRSLSILFTPAAVLLFFVTASTQAVELSTNGVGDVLFSPYYTVRTATDKDGFPAGQYQTFLDISNSGSDTVAFRLNIREAQNGRLCTKLNVVLSAHDVWTAAIQETTNGVRLFTVDRSCTSPQMTANGNGQSIAFTTEHFTTNSAPNIRVIPLHDAGSTDIDRCKEGFIEVISMGHSGAANSATPGTVAYHAHHVNGVPRDCQKVDQALSDPISATTHTEFKEATNVLKGMYTLINVANGIAYGGNFVALENFHSPTVLNGEGADGSSDADLLFTAKDIFSDIPNLSAADPKESIVHLRGNDGNQRTIVDQWTNGVDAVSAVLTRNRAFNQWTTNNNLGAETAWVVTLPTSRFYTFNNTASASEATPPFAELFDTNAAILDSLSLPHGGACNAIGIQLYDRHDQLLATRFAPQNPGSTPLLCYAVNPITFNETNLIGSSIARNMNSQGVKNGWMDFNLALDNAANPSLLGGLGSSVNPMRSHTADEVYGGLPVIASAFTIRSRSTNTSSSNYGSLWDHSYALDVQKPSNVVCTQDVKQCPYDKFVSRIPPSCEFAACPTYIQCTEELIGCPDGSTTLRVEPTCEFFCPTVIPTKLLSTSPQQSENNVAVTREFMLNFDKPINPASVNNVSIKTTGLTAIQTTYKVSSDQKKVTLFYPSQLPSNSTITVLVDGDQLTDQNSQAVDADGDGVAGGQASITFNTSNLTVVAGTSVCGRIVGATLQANLQTVDEPLVNAIVTVDGAEATMNATTDTNGDFCLNPAPGQRFFVHFDGRTISNTVPAGTYYPFLGKALEPVAGQQHNIGTVYLPLVTAGTLQTVSNTTDTEISFPASVLQLLPQFTGVKLTVPAGSLFSDDGTSGGKVGIAPVAPQRMPGPLPTGANPPLVITIQTDGPSNFDTPAPVCFPNLPEKNNGGQKLNAGEQRDIMSYNHDTGHWETAAPATVSADGQLICSDPGSGIKAPGWHFVFNPGPTSAACIANPTDQVCFDSCNTDPFNGDCINACTIDPSNQTCVNVCQDPNNNMTVSFCPGFPNPCLDMTVDLTTFGCPTYDACISIPKPSEDPFCTEFCNANPGVLDC